MIYGKRWTDRASHWLITSFMILVGVICFLPIWYAINVSILPYKDYVADSIHLLPRGFTLYNYIKPIQSDPFLIKSFENGLLVTTGTVLLTLFTTIISAFVLTRSKMAGRRIYSLLFVIPMFFGGGLIPTYLLYQKLGLLNSLGGLMFYGCLTPYWMLILKATMESIPPALEESAFLDGANEFQVLWYVMIPLCRATLACICLMIGVYKWNEFFWAQIVMQDPAKYTFQVYLRNLFAKIAVISNITVNTGEDYSTMTGVRMAITMIGIIPVIVAYPLVQRYFVKGIMMGSIKA